MPVIGTNTAANTAILYLNKNSSAQEESLGHLSSGSKIVSASDDAAGLAVSTQLASDISVLGQACTNAQQAQSVMNVADGALSNIADILQRMKSLSAQSMSGAIDDTSRGYINAEFTELSSEIDAIISTTAFNGVNLVDASYSETFLVGTDATDTIVVTLGVGITVAGNLTVGVDTLANATTVSAELDTLIGLVSGVRSDVGACQSRFEFRENVINTAVENLVAAKSTILDTDIAEEQSRYTTAQVMTEVATAALAQANNMKTSLLSLVQ
ncbi:MAG: flagellin [Alphaproteobacteria bacterium]|nr:flagellin [Alphaproteobacteria bacterium]